jgi:hypothetical protein
MSYVVDIVSSDRAGVLNEFRTLLHDSSTGSDAAQLGLALRRLAQNTSAPQPNNPRLRTYTYPDGGTCTAFYAFESSGGTRMFLLGFCEATAISQHYNTAHNRLLRVP